MLIGSESRPIILDLYREKTQIRLRIYNTDTCKLLGKHHYINCIVYMLYDDELYMLKSNKKIYVYY